MGVQMDIKEIKATLKQLKMELRELESNKEPQAVLEASFANAKSKEDVNFDLLHSQAGKIENKKREIAFFEEKAEQYRIEIEPAERTAQMQEQMRLVGEKIAELGAKLYSQIESSLKGLKLPKTDILNKFITEAGELYSDYLNNVEAGTGWGRNHNDTMIRSFKHDLKPIEFRVYGEYNPMYSVPGFTKRKDDIGGSYYGATIYDIIQILPAILHYQNEKINETIERKADFDKLLKPLPKELNYE